MNSTKRKARKLPRPSINGDAVHAKASAVSPSAASPSAVSPSAVSPTPPHHRTSRRKRPPERIKRRVAVAEIRRLGSECDSHDPRKRLLSLARAIAAGEKAAEITKPGGLLDAVIDAAENGEGLAGRATAAEAAAWGLAWAARSKRSSVASGAALQRIEGIASSLLPALEIGDTTPAGFLLVLGRLFADVEACDRFAPLAVAAVEAEIEQLMPSDGAIGRTGSEAILETVARWAGVHLRAEETGDVPWSPRVRDALLSAIETAMRLLPADRRHGKPAAVRGGWTMQPGWESIVEVAGRHGLQPAASRSVGGFAVIRSGRGRRSTRILVDARGSAMHLEVVVESRLLCCGEWSFEASADGVALEPSGPWADSCFESEKAAKSQGATETTFAEWTLPLSRGLRLERQLVFAPRDRVLLVADAIVPSEDSTRAGPADSPRLAMEIEYRTGLPVCPGIEFEAAEETRELIGFDESVRLMALPLALPEWSSASCDGRLEAEPGRLVHARRSRVARTYTPIWLDLDAARIGEPLTWRRLTVADSRQNLPEHRGCGYRIQVGGSQWLVYRGLDAVRNRSVLGCNLACEFLLGRVGRSGTVERLIEIQ